jgi:citrate lyase subunit beta/citryl-CoA lyase
VTVLLLAAKARSFLFVPGHQPERYSKALGSGADMVILDLEDSVGPADKPPARESIAAAWSSHADQRDRLLVRLNPDSTPFHKADLDLLASLPGLRGIMVPKAENSQLFAGIAAAFPSVYLLPMVESAEGMARIDEIARAPSVARIGVGHIDLQADLGMSCNEDEVELGPMRFAIVMASRRANIAPPIDGVTTAITDTAAISRDTLRSRRFGFSGKLCIHPSQVSHVHAAFAPTPEEIVWAKRIIDTLTDARGGAFSVDGKMVDAPMISLARQLLRAAG